MTTREFSSTKLPYPKYSLEVGRFSLCSRKQESSPRVQPRSKKHKSSNYAEEGSQPSLKLPSTCLPRFSYMLQLVEVKEPGNTIPGHIGQHIKDFLGSHIVIDNARPELFLRRDFISKFAQEGRVFISQIPDSLNHDYKISMTIDNVMRITMNAKQYRRFGLVAKKVTTLAPENFGTKEKCYCTEIDLKDERLMKNNKFQDKMMGMLRRLSPINKIYFRFVPHIDKSNLSISAANELSVEYFKYVIDEYALDGCEPVPLTNCSAVCQRVERHWLNCAQLHPKLDVACAEGDHRKLSGNNIIDANNGRTDENGAYDENDELANIMEIIDWLGYQLLALDCDKLEIKSNYPHGGNPRHDVSCTQIVGPVDHQHIEHNLRILFGKKRPEDQGVVLRALLLHNMNQLRFASGAYRCLENVSPYSNAGNNSGVVYIQDCNNGSKAANEITVIGMSALAG